MNTLQVYEQKTRIRNRINDYGSLCNIMNTESNDTLQVSNNYDGTISVMGDSMDNIEHTLKTALRKWLGEDLCPLQFLYHTLPISANHIVVKL